jgi:hypothetical protein
MARYLLLALNGPTGPDAETAYNRWYDEIHLPDLLDVPGVTSARRFKTIQGNVPFPYVAAYEIDTDNLPGLLKVMEEQPRPFDPSFDRSTSGHILAVAL